MLQLQKCSEKNITDIFSLSTFFKLLCIMTHFEITVNVNQQGYVSAPPQWKTCIQTQAIPQVENN